MKKIINLLEKYIKIYKSEKNLENKSFFKKTKSIITDKFRGVPKDLNEIDNKIPFVFWLSIDFWRDLFCINIERFYKDPLYYLENWLKVKIFYFKNFNDCNCFENFIPIWLGEGFDATFFGCKLNYKENSEPAIDKNYILINDPKDLDKLKIPNFSNSKPMNLAVKFYNDISNIVNDYGIDVGFYDWHYGPTSLCNYLRGFENISLDFLLNKEFVKKLMEFIVNSRINWSREREKFLGNKINRGGSISNDDVCVPNISPNIYNELIFPHEFKLYKFYNNFSYYHDCGPIDPFLEKISEFKNIDLIHSGPFSDYKKVGEIFGYRSPIELHLNPVKDFIYCSESDFKNKLLNIKKIYSKLDVKSYCIRLTSYTHPGLSTIGNLNKLKKWCDVSKNILLK